jgi:hypothetical protein
MLWLCYDERYLLSFHYGFAHEKKMTNFFAHRHSVMVLQAKKNDKHCSSSLCFDVSRANEQQ